MGLDPTVSIVIPVYNGSNYLREAIDSALAQTYKNIEVIVVNDGSDDEGKTEAIAKSYGDKIRYLYKKNGGGASALNIGIKVAEGEYISWLGHDDVYMPNKLEVQINYLGKTSKLCVLYSNYYFVDSESKIIKECTNLQVPPNKFYQALLTTHVINGATPLLPKKAIINAGYFNEKLKVTYDYDMWLKLNKDYDFILLNEYLIKYRLHKDQDTFRLADLCKAEQAQFYEFALGYYDKKSVKYNLDSIAQVASGFKLRGLKSAYRRALWLSFCNARHLEDFYNIFCLFTLKSKFRIAYLGDWQYAKTLPKRIIKKVVVRVFRMSRR